MTALQPRHTAPVPIAERARGAALRDYLSLTKPRIIELLLVTTFPVMFLAERGVPPPGLIVATMAGGALAAASSNVLNCYLDRDIDRLMHRTANRPLAAGTIPARNALLFGAVLAALALTILAAFVNALAALLAGGAMLMYVVGYTMVLKRRTAQNIVWGGLAGCMPVLIAWAAVTGSLSVVPFVLFLVVFCWTPPHYWPLSMRFRDEYAAAGVPMLPVVAHDVHVARQVTAYAWVTVAISLLLVPVAPMGWVYLLSALAAGAVFVLEAHRLLARAKDPANVTLAAIKPMRLFHYSISYLTIVFAAVAVDPLLYFPLPG